LRRRIQAVVNASRGGTPSLEVSRTMLLRTVRLAALAGQQAAASVTPSETPQ